jgi:uncharacterized repeat protein (TIGR01451 family)
MNNYDMYKSVKPNWLNSQRIKNILFLLGIAIALGFGLALAAPAHGAPVGQGASGDISGTITVAGGNAAGIAVDLRQHDNSGVITLLASTTTDENGVYHFLNQGSTPGTAYFEIKVTGGQGMLAVWYSFPIIYLSGQNFTVPSIEMADVALLSPKPGTDLALPGKLTWIPRRSGETFRVSVYEAGKLDKSILDSGSLGMNATYSILDGSLAPGSYEAVVGVRDAVVGFGVSQQHFQFTVGAGGSTNAQPTPGLSSGTPEAPTPVPAQATAVPSGQPELALHLTADKTEVGADGAIVYTLAVSNKGSSVAPGVVATDQLPAGVTVDASAVTSSVGQVSVNGSSITVQIGDLNPNDTVLVTIPATIAGAGLSNVSNQASALFTGVTEAVMSNAYVAQIAQAVAPTDTPQSEPTSEPEGTATTPAEPSATEVATEVVEATSVPASDTPVPAVPTAEAATPAAAPTEAVVAQAPTVVSEPTLAPVAPTPKPRATQTVKGTGGGASQGPAAPIPQTGGSFPITFAILLLAVTLAARYLRGYLRGRNTRRT